MSLRVIWQYMDRSVTQKILVHIIFFWWRTGPYTAMNYLLNIACIFIVPATKDCLFSVLPNCPYFFCGSQKWLPRISPSFLFIYLLYIVDPVIFLNIYIWCWTLSNSLSVDFECYGFASLLAYNLTGFFNYLFNVVIGHSSWLHQYCLILRTTTH
jgi:hypothetical protein